MGTPFSGTSSVVGSKVAIVPIRATGQQRIVTNVNVDLAGEASLILNGSADAGTTESAIFAFFENYSGPVPPVSTPQGNAILGTAASGTASFALVSGYDGDVGEYAGQISATVSDLLTEGGDTNYETLYTATSTTEVIEVYKVLISADSATLSTCVVGYDDDGAGTNFVAITPTNVGFTNYYDLGAFKVPAGKYLSLFTTVSGGGGAQGTYASFAGRQLRA